MTNRELFATAGAVSCDYVTIGLMIGMKLIVVSGLLDLDSVDGDFFRLCDCIFQNPEEVTTNERWQCHDGRRNKSMATNCPITFCVVI